MDELDRILGSEPVIRPSSSFGSEVMRAVRTEAAAPPPIEFPWRRALPGFFVSVTLAFAAFIVVGLTTTAPVPTPPAAETVGQLNGLLQAESTRGLMFAAAALIGTLALAWVVARPRSSSPLA